MRFFKGRGRKIFLGLNCVILALAGVVLVPAFAMADVPGAYNSYGYATGVHYVAGSDAFPNFEHGAVNNRYPLAEVAQDASPSSTAVATYTDSGPLVATGGSAYNQSCNTGSSPPPSQICQNPNNSVPYAKSSYPGGPDKSHIDSCNNQGSSCPAAGADASAAQLNASASGYYAGGAGAQQPFSGASGKTSTVVDSNGNLTVVGHSEVQNWSMGTVQVSKVVVDVTATSTVSSGSGDAHVVAGNVTVNGTPVGVTDQGITVQSAQPIPCSSIPQPPPVGAPGPVPGGGPGGGTGPGPGPLPSPPVLPPIHSMSGQSRGSSASEASGGACVPGVDITVFKIYTVQPTKKIEGSHVLIWATGLHIVATHPSPGPGVPTQSTEYILGEGYAETQAGAGVGGFGGFGGFDGLDGFGGFGGFDSSGIGAPGSPSALGSNIHAALVANRVPLALMFLTLEALLLASAAAWVWARNTPVERVPDEVLSP